MKPGYWQAAAVLLASVLLAGCNRSEQIERLTGEAEQAQKRGEHELALARWSAALRLNPRNREAYLQRAALYEATGKGKLAIQDYSEYLRLPTNRTSLKEKVFTLAGRGGPPPDETPERATVFCRRGLLYGKEGDFERAAADLDEATRLTPDGPTPYLCRAQLSEWKGQPEAALALYTKAIQVATNDAAGYSYRGFFYTRRGNGEQAIADLNEALRLEPENPRALLHRGVAKAMHGEADAALEDLDDAARASPDDPDVYAARGALLLDKGDYQRAFDDFNQTLLLRPNDPVALARRGFAWTKKGNVEFALADLNKAIALNPAEAIFYAWRGAALVETNKLNAALADLDRALQLSTNEAGLYVTRGYIFVKRQEYSRAAADIARGMQLNPGGPEACNSMAWLRATCPNDAFRDGQEAVRLATKACELTGFKVFAALDTLAAAYAEAGDFEKAISYEKQSLALVSATHHKRSAMEERLSLYEQHKPFREKPPQ